MTLSNAIAWMEIPDARKTMGADNLPALAYFLDGCFDWYRAGVRTFILSSSPQWMGYDPPGDAKQYGDLYRDVRSLVPPNAALIPGARPLKSHLSSMWDVDGWKSLGDWVDDYSNVVLDMEVIFEWGRFESIDLNGWYQSLLALPKDVVIWWNFPCILPNDDKSPNRLQHTTILCRFIEWLRPNDKIMDSSVAWQGGTQPLLDAWKQRRDWMLQLGPDRLIDRMLIAPNSDPFQKGDGLYFTTDNALMAIALEPRINRPQIIWTDAERWTAVAAEARKAEVGNGH